MKTFVISSAAILLVLLTIGVSAHGGGKHGGRGRGMMKKFKTCNGTEADFSSFKPLMDECKKDGGDQPPPPEGDNEGQSGPKKGKKHGGMHKFFHCVAKKAGVVNEDGSVNWDGLKTASQKAFGNDIGMKLGQALETSCKDEATPDPEGKMKGMKCFMKTMKQECHKDETDKED